MSRRREPVRPGPLVTYGNPATGAGLLMLLEQLPVVLWTTDTRLRITSAIGAALATMGFGDKAWVGHPLEDLLAAHFPNSRGLAIHRDALRGTTTAFDGEVSGIALSILVSPLLDEAGRIIGTIGVGADVSAQRRMRADLNERNERLAQLLLQVPAAIWTTDESLVIASMDGNVLAARPTDNRGTPIDLRRLLQRHSPEGLAAHQRALEGHSGAFDFVWENRTYEVHVEPFRTTNGNRAGVVGVALDVTERRRAEAGLQFIDAADRTLAEAFSDPALLGVVVKLPLPKLADFCLLDLCDARGRYRRMAAAAADEADAALAAELHALSAVPVEHDDDSCPRCSGDPMLLTCLDEADLTKLTDTDEQRRLLRRSGASSALVIPLAARGRLFGSLMLLRKSHHRPYDRADLDLARAFADRAALAIDDGLQFRRMRVLSDASRELMEAADFESACEGLVGSCVPGLADWCALHSLQNGELRLQCAADAQSERLPLVREVFGWPGGAIESLRQRVARDGQPVVLSSLTDEEFHRIAPCESSRAKLRKLGPASYLAAPLRVRGGEIIGVLELCVTDERPGFDSTDLETVTELAHRAAFRLENALVHRAAVAAAKARDDVLAIVSHDLRTPLATATLAMQMAIGEAPEGAARERISMKLQPVERALVQMQRLVTDLLDLSALESGRLRLHLAPVRPADVADEVVEEIHGAAAHRGVELRCTVDEALPAVLVDRGRLLQILTNLMGNAVKVSPRGQRVQLAAQRDASGLRFSVIDRGRGISKEQQAQLFRPYWQALPNRGGVGLGLSIAHALTKAMNGEIWFETEEGQGTTFHVRLPLAA